MLTIVPPSVQFANVNPVLAVAVTVTDVPETNVPPPVTVPPAAGFALTVMAYVPICTKTARTVQ